ncbi:MAG: flagellar hook-length control protein FliK [Neomegalonema sp.]|nr:flagellar hook-length control protein FliK [Neomegalonema sp.]
MDPLAPAPFASHPLPSSSEPANRSEHVHDDAETTFDAAYAEADGQSAEADARLEAEEKPTRADDADHTDSDKADAPAEPSAPAAEASDVSAPRAEAPKPAFELLPSSAPKPAPDKANSAEAVEAAEAAKPSAGPATEAPLEASPELESADGEASDGVDLVSDAFAPAAEKKSASIAAEPKNAPAAAMAAPSSLTPPPADAEEGAKASPPTAPSTAPPAPVRDKAAEPEELASAAAAPPAADRKPRDAATAREGDAIETDAASEPSAAPAARLGNAADERSAQDGARREPERDPRAEPEQRRGVEGAETATGKEASAARYSAAYETPAARITGLAANDAPLPGGALDLALDPITGADGVVGDLVRERVESAAPSGATAAMFGGRGAEAARAAASQIGSAVLKRGDNTRLEITLDPPELGKVRLEMSFNEAGKVSVMVQAERGDTLDLLRRHSDELAKELKEAGLSLDDMSFAERGDAQSFAEQTQDPGVSRRVAVLHAAAADVMAPPPPARGAMLDGRLDLRV